MENLKTKGQTAFDKEAYKLYCSVMEANDACNILGKNLYKFLRKSSGKKVKAKDKIEETKAISDNATKITESLQELQSKLMSMPGILEKEIGQLITKEIEICTLEMEKCLITMKRKSDDFMAETLDKASRKKENIDTKAILSFITETLIAISVPISIALGTINAILDAIPTDFKIEAEGMTLLSTPKNPKPTDITPPNEGMNICCKLPEAVTGKISEISQKANLFNNELRAATVLSAGADGENILFEGRCKSVAQSAPIANADGLVEQIENLVDLTIMPEALPKYEKLHPANPSYMLYMISTFCPAVTKSFGMPGM